MESEFIEARTIGITGIIPFLREGSDEEKECRHIFNYLNSQEEETSTTKICKPNLLFECPEYRDLQLPTQYRPGSSLSDHTIMLVFEWFSLNNGCGTMVFALDPYEGALSHIFTKKDDKRYPFFGRDAYAAVDDKFYFVGGCFRNHDLRKTYEDALFNFMSVEKSASTVISKAKAAGKIENKKNLEVETFNLRTGKWDDKTLCTKLDAPKHHPIVFTFDSKIYAIAAKRPYWYLGDSFRSFEFLDTTAAIKSTSESPTIWKSFEPPPFIAVDDTRHFLWKEKKCLFVKVSDDDSKGRIGLLWKFDLVSNKWYNNTTDPLDLNYDPKDSQFLNSLTDVPARHFEGCIVHNILFYFEDARRNYKARLLVGHDLGGEKVIPRRWKINLKDILQDVGHKTISTCQLFHLENFNFCLVINYRPSYGWNVNFLCICKFKLLLKSDEVMPQNFYDFHSMPTLVERKYFQLPNRVILTYHTKLENRDGLLRDDTHFQRDMDEESTTSVNLQTT